MSNIIRSWDNPAKFGADILRIAFGIFMILVAVKKFRVGLPIFAESLVGGNKALGNEMPAIVLLAYGYTLPFVELIVGIMLLAKQKVCIAYQVLALVYISFIIGQQYDGNTAKIGTEYFPSLLTLVVGYYLHKQSKISQRVE